MRRPVETRLRDCVAGTALAAPLAASVQPLLEERGDDDALARMDDALLRGVARAVAGQPETAVFLSHRPGLLERLADAGANPLGERAQELREASRAGPAGDLELALDMLRLLRREETCVTACLHLAGLVSFEEASEFLSVVAESVLQRALELATAALGSGAPTPELAVIGLGKVAGREFTYHSDLDLVFLTEAGPDSVDRASRVGQRLIAYLSTMTGAGVAYTVDTRLRPSGGQGMLVTSFPAFQRYQCERAQTWEHLAMLRARAVAGSVSEARATLQSVRDHVLASHPEPWEELAEMRARVERERATDATDRIPFKTGSGGLMDVDFLAGGGLMERRLDEPPELPSVPAMLRAAARGPRVERLLDDYAFLRRVEASARWMAGRSVEALDDRGEALAVAAELTEPGLGAAELRERLAALSGRIREDWDRVTRAGSISALD